MRIQGIGSSIPSRRIDVRESIELVKYHSPKTPSADMENILNSIDQFFTHSGLKTRSGRIATEKPLDMIVDCIARASSQAGLPLSDIDGVVYCSIHRGVAEPASASIVSKAIGIRPKHAFDVLDACMGWGTALEICNKYLNDGSWETAIVVSSEFPNEPNGSIVPGCYSIANHSELNTKIAGMTMGEAAVATVLSNGENEDWSFIREEHPEHAKLCAVPLSEHHLFAENETEFVVNGERVFMANARELAVQGFRYCTKNLGEYIDKYGKPNVLIPHSVSQIFPVKAARKFSMADAVFSTFQEFGNLATASLPITLDTGIRRGRILKRDTVAGWIGSAGMKFCTFPIRLSDRVF